MKSETIFCLRRMPNGEVIGHVITEDGVIVETIYFGEFTRAEYKDISKAIRRECPDLNVFKCEALK